jgi:hypothetical protein
MKLSDRVDALEHAVVKHLEESGEIRADLKWLKKSFWALAGLGTAVGGSMAAEVVIRFMGR